VPILRVALAQVNPTVGDLPGNAAIVRQYAARAWAAGADLVAFPEMMLTGYPIEDLALRPSFQRASRRATEALAADLVGDGLGELPVVVGRLNVRDGAVHRVGVPRNEPLNAAAVLFGGRVVAKYAKHHLPNYGVFDETRYFVPGQDSCVVRIGGVDVALAICEDLWQDGGPVAAVREQGAGLLLVINGSPFEIAKHDARLQLCRRRAAEAGCTLAYVNMVGGQDELVFGGDSIVVATDGTVLARAPQFTDDLLIVDLDLPAAAAREALPDGTPIVDLGPGRPDSRPPAPVLADAGRRTDVEQVYRALVVGLRDYVEKNGFASVALGLSGGIDSALVAAIAVDALGADRVHGVSMPSRYSSDHSRDDALDLAERTGLRYRTVPIGPMFDAYLASLDLTGLAEENLQARIRGVILMAISNQEGPLVLATGNKTEIAVGYSTIYGDAVGGFAPIKDVPKTLVWQLCRWRNAQAEAAGQVPPIPERSITKPPSAELRPDQQDSDSLPDYALLDDILDDYVEADRSAYELVEDGFDPATVERILRLTDLAEYKRRQYPPGTKISSRAFGRDRRQPITNRWREQIAP
jgi:NAD+ synthase (glutamine-hydrolysing)